MVSLSGRAARGRKRPVRAALAALVLAGACGGGSETAGPAASVPPGCTPVRSPEVLGADHIAAGQKATYNTTPPTSGEHYARPALAALYDFPIPNEQQVHNLEHGHVLIQYRDLTDAEIRTLIDMYSRDTKMLILAPYPDMDSRLALTAWGKIQTCDAWSEGFPRLAESFIRAHRDNAPESIP